MDQFLDALRDCMDNLLGFIRRLSGIRLRQYQERVAVAVVQSVVEKKGLSFVVMFPRQSGKNELQAQIETYLLTLYSQKGAEMVKVSPTWKPQAINAMNRLERTLENNLVTQTIGWRKENGFQYRVGKSRIHFFSGQPGSNIVGATASTLLEVDEAQDVLISKYDKDIAPMAASANATRVFWGTAWTANTLLARELRACREAERKDGIERVFVINADDVAAELPAYGEFVAEQVQKLGRNHPMVKTQYYSEEIESEGGMFGPERLAMMGFTTTLTTELTPTPTQPITGEKEGGKIYAILIDVAGEEEGQTLTPTPTLPLTLSGRCAEGEGVYDQAGRRDSTALTVVEVDLSLLADPIIRAPVYRVVHRQLWTGVKHTTLYAQLRAIIELWQARHVVIDATGVGATLTSFLDKAFPGRVIPFVFTSVSKSKLGWDFMGIVDSGRFKDIPANPLNSVTNQPQEEGERLRALFYKQCCYTQFEIVPGPDRRIRWGVPEGMRDMTSGEYLHDDLVVSAALCAVLDGLDWAASGETLIIEGKDPLKTMDSGW